MGTLRRLGIALAAVLPVPALCPGIAAAAPADTAAVSVYLTDLSSQTYLSRQPSLSWRSGEVGAAPVIAVDTSRRYQQIAGFGASLTDSSAWLIGTRLDSRQRDALMQDLFTSKGIGIQGIGLSFLRQPMGASDFAVNGNYSYDDMPPGQTDPALARFSIDHDRSYILPLLRQAEALNPALTVMATPWSPPGWMKTSDSMIGGTLAPGAYGPLATYFAKFLAAYAAAGVPIRYVTPQNEPLYVPSGYPGMSLPAASENGFIRDFLGPELRRYHLATGILGYDHNWDVVSYPESLYANPFVAGTAWHCYAGDVLAQAISHNDYPNEPVFQTECSGGDWEGDAQAGFAAAVGLVINATRNWAQGVIRWNLALDQNNGPTNGGCLTCRGVVRIAPDATGHWSYTPTADYWGLGQASAFVRPGARRVASSTFGPGGVQDVAFVNPDGSTALVAFNSGATAQAFQVRWGDRSFGYRLAPGAAATFTWTGTQRGSLPPAATGSVDIPFRNRDGSQALITYDAGMLAGQAQVRVGDQWLGYTLPTGASLTPPSAEQALPRAGWTVSASASSPDDPPGNAVDGDPATRWSTGHGMQPGDWYQVDLGAPRTFNQVVLDTSGSAGDFVRQYQLQVSADGVTWTAPIATGPGTTVTRIQFPAVTGRYVRIVNQGSSGSWWSIHELTVYAPAGAAPVPGPAGTVQRRGATLPDGTRVDVTYNAGRAAATFPVRWAGTTYTYVLPAGAAAVFTTRGASG